MKNTIKEKRIIGEKILTDFYTWIDAAYAMSGHTGGVISMGYFSKAMAAQISRLKNPHTSLHTYAKNVPEATRKKIYTASNGQ